MREERQDSTDHCDCADRHDPVLSHDPNETSDSADPIDPTDSALPIDPTDRAEPTDPMDSTDPTEPIDSTESCDHRDNKEFEPVRCVDDPDVLVMRPSCLPLPRVRSRCVPRALTERHVFSGA